MSTDRSTQHSASQNGENGGGVMVDQNALFCRRVHGGGGGRVQRLGAASQQCHDLITRCNEWNQPLVRTTAHYFLLLTFYLESDCELRLGRGDDIMVKLRVGSQKTRAGLRYSNHYPASIKARVRNLTSSGSLCILHLRTIITTIHQLRGGGEEDLLLWFLIFFGECWTTHARAQFNLNLC